MELSIIVTHHNQSLAVSNIVARFASEKVSGAEMIVVDDASDSSEYERALQSVDAAIRQDAMITVTHLNDWGGAGGARNAGADLALGRYLWFVDGDDEIYPGAVERIVAKCRETSADIVMLPHTCGHGVNTTVHSLDDCEALPPTYQWRIAPWGKLVKANVFTPFPERVFYEDTDWHFVQCDRATTRDYLRGRPVYFYEMDPSGGSQMSGIKRLEANYNGARKNLAGMLADGDKVLNRAIAHRLMMIGRLVDACDNKIRSRNIKDYVRRFAQLMLESVQPEKTGGKDNG